TSTPFPYTTLFRSHAEHGKAAARPAASYRRGTPATADAVAPGCRRRGTTPAAAGTRVEPDGRSGDDRSPRVDQTVRAGARGPGRDVRRTGRSGDRVPRAERGGEDH